MKKMIVSEVMSTSPHSVGEEQPIKVAREMMRRYGIRHLPVKHAGKLVGVLSERDIDLALQIQLESSSLGPGSAVLVRDVETTDVMTVAPGDDVANVARMLAERRIGCAVVTDSTGSVVGMFTSTDACRLLSEILSRP